MHRLLALGAAAFVALALSGSALAWSWPADGDVLRPFSLGTDAYAAGQHRGVDVAGAAGSAVVAPASGTVSFAGSLPAYGRGVTILTADGYAVTLVHLGAIGVAKGATVEEGQPVATMGWSGDPEHSVPSVHLGVRVAARQEGYVDPTSLLPPRVVAPVAPSPPAPVPAPAPDPAPAPSPPPAAGPTPGPPPAQAPSPPPVAVTPAVPTPASTGTAASGPVPAPTATTGQGVASEPLSPTQPFRITGRPATARPPVHAGLADVVPRGPSSPPTSPRPAQLVRSTSARPTSTSARTWARRASAPDLASSRSTPWGDRSPTPEVDDRQRQPATPAVSTGHSSTSVRGRAERVEHPPAQTVRTAPREDLVTRSAASPLEAIAGSTAGDDRGSPASGVVAATVALLLLALGVSAEVARRIGADGAVLRHHADLLRQLHAAHRPRVYDRRGGRARSSSAAARP